MATGGVTPYTWSITQGALPTGLALTNDTIGGTPTAGGTYNITVQVRDSASQTATQALSLSIVIGVKEYIFLNGRVIAIETQ